MRHPESMAVVENVFALMFASKPKAKNHTISLPILCLIMIIVMYELSCDDNFVGGRTLMGSKSYTTLIPQPNMHIHTCTYIDWASQFTRVASSFGPLQGAALRTMFKEVLEMILIIIHGI